MKPGYKRYRPDKDGSFQTQFKEAKRRIFATQTICGICGKPVDFSLKFPNPGSPCIDHIIPIAKGGHPAAMENLQLAHLSCNRWKSDKLTIDPVKAVEEKIVNDDLPLSLDWINYKGDGSNFEQLATTAEEMTRKGLTQQADGIKPANLKQYH